MRIISRYIYREVGLTLLAVVSVLLLIFLCNQFVRYLTAAAAGKMSGLLILRLLLLQIPSILGFLLPLGLFLAILLAYGRLYADGEMTVLRACGVSSGQMLKITLLLILGVSLLVSSLTLWLAPKVLTDKFALLARARTTSLLETIQPGRFKLTKDGRLAFYVEKMTINHKHVQNIFVAEKMKPDAMNAWTVTSAKEGYQMIDPKTGNLFFILTNGYRYEGVPGKKDYRIMHYDKYGVKIPNQTTTVHVTEEEALPSLLLWKMAKAKLSYMAELQWRIALPISVIVLGLLAVPLSQIKPRQGRFAHFLPAILLYIIYTNMLFANRAWIINKNINPYLGVWIIHGAALLLVLGLWWMQRIKHRPHTYSTNRIG